jgi:hypothetical protein
MAERAIQLSFFALVIAANVLQYRSQILWSWISMLCAFGLWLAFYLRYAKGASRTTTPKFEPVTFLVGIFFVIAGVWAAIIFLPGTPTVVGSLLLTVIFVLFPVCYGLVIVRNQLRLRRNAN